jgi:lipopolysaccharide transport system ATP-binding protein
MSKTVISVQNISKQYRLGEVGTGTLSHDLKKWWYKARGKEDPYLKIGEANDRASKAESDYVWALKDINFEVKQGDVLGIIGRNGAGKSTLLKILSKTTTPTTGSIKVKGRIASLLEVGTGFHPEMTGRENIYLNGAILGMTRREIKSKFDEIVDFSGVERYIDTPVKRYSSGMYVRLAFAVAAHLEPDILIIDEVLAVGDAEFQKKCLGKMKDVSVNEGRTVLFVSHNMDAVNKLCSKGILLCDGSFNFSGDINKTILSYLDINRKNQISKGVIDFNLDINKKAQIKQFFVRNKEGIITTDFISNQDIYIEIIVINKVYKNKLRMNLSLLDKYENIIFIDRRIIDFEGEKIMKYKIGNGFLVSGGYLIGLAIDEPNVEVYDIPEKKMPINILDLQNNQLNQGDSNNGIILLPINYCY